MRKKIDNIHPFDPAMVKWRVVVEYERKCGIKNVQFARRRHETGN